MIQAGIASYNLQSALLAFEAADLHESLAGYTKLGAHISEVRAAKLEAVPSLAQPSTSENYELLKALLDTLLMFYLTPVKQLLSAQYSEL